MSHETRLWIPIGLPAMKRFPLTAAPVAAIPAFADVRRARRATAWTKRQLAAGGRAKAVSRLP